jgi:hypothetical protein
LQSVKNLDLQGLKQTYLLLPFKTMSRRFSRILQSARYYGAISRYMSWIQGQTTRGVRIGQGEPRPVSQVLYVTPFAIQLAAGQKVKQTCAQPSWNTYGGRFSTYTTSTAPADAGNIIKPADYRAAHVIIKTGVLGQATVKTSTITGLQYGSYGGRSTSIPFGKATGSDEQLAVFSAIKTNLETQLSGNYRVSLTREKFKGI